jgi:ABC-type antimicrobial peptide transport system permease subunit
MQEELAGAAYVNVMPLTRLVDPNLRSWEFGATMFVAFGGLALLRAAIGMYSVIAYDVAQRTRDLSVRVALGASMSNVLGMVVRRGVSLVATGAAIGAVLALWAAPTMTELLFDQSPRDPAVYGSVAGILLLVGVLAAVPPARRAARVDPNLALRGD